MSVATPIIAPVPDQWPEHETAQGASTLDQVVHASHLLGANRALANYGGGNTSAKGVAVDHLGRQVAAIWVKGSGSDLATMSAADFTPLRLDEILPLLERPELSDEDMVAYLARCQLDPAAPRSSIETLLHAFIPAAHVHHTHPDAINALACAADGRGLIAECFGDAAVWIEYIRPGFTLAKQVGEAVRANPDLRLVVLAKHGLVVWGQTAREAYEQTVAVCNRAADLVNSRSEGSRRFGGPAADGAQSADERAATLAQLLPTLRGAVSSARAKVLLSDLSPAVCELVDSRDGPEIATVGAACPDHLVHTKRVPMWVAYDPARDGVEQLRERIAGCASAYREEYEAYFTRNAGPGDQIADPDPRVVLIQNVGMVAVGQTPKAAGISRDLYHRAIEVMAGASAVSQFISLTEAESFAVEYWPLELYKLSLAPPPGELQGKIALVTGAAGGIGRAVMETLAAAGASVVAFDIDADGAADAVAPLGDLGLAVSGDVTSEEAVAAAFAAAVTAFGGVDIVVSNAGIASSAPISETTLAEWQRNQSVLGTGYFLVAREAFRVMRPQGLGGSIVFVASKNSLVAGPNASAYSSAKAAELHLARCLAEEGGSAGIRVNTVNPDAVLQGSRIWDSSWRSERADAYGIRPDQLEEHYRRRTTLGVNVLPEDVARAVLHFASTARSGKTTGNLLNVDGGVAAAYPR
ncbi:MAG TPA: bifunctional aldolase/short-chain dehydrogenase [Solirubrobacteraceae bacterium]|nr:bifunctional aldolase/short-chain dehydrogenase [Solirubrobacteraceae bacterium]